MLDKLKNGKFSLIGTYFLFKSYDEKSLEEFLKEYELDGLIKYYSEIRSLEPDENELMNFFDGDYERLAKDLALFFAPFLPEDFVISRDLEKLRLQLVSVYGNDITEAIIKALEILSILSYPKEIEEKDYLLKEVLKIMILLSKIMILLKDGDEVK